ncbi:MAG TPA: HYR domain-containing protein, partial [Gillisia sp.]|nr:HYR domain-containing protein [Gillisia sp.]
MKHYYFLKFFLLFLLLGLCHSSGWTQTPIFSPGMAITPFGSVSSPPGEDLTKIIDQNVYSKFLDFNIGDGMGFTVYMGGNSYVANNLEITTANDFSGRDPQNFEVLGSNNGTTFTSVATGSIPCVSSRYFKRSINFTNTTAFKYYRINYTNRCAINNYEFQVAETQLFGYLLTPPTAVCKEFTAQLDASGNVAIFPNDVDGGSGDDKEGFTLSLDKDNFDCSNLGPNEVELTVTDSDGLTATCMATVIVEDTVSPTITCPGNIVVDNDPGICGAVIIYNNKEEFYSSKNGNELIKINVNSGEITNIGAFGFSNTFTITFTPDGNAWTLVNSNQLGKVDIETGTVTPIGTPFSFSSYSIDSDSSGQLYVLGADSNLYKINSITGVSTLIAYTGLSSQMDISFDPWDKLYAINSSNNLYSINITTGELKTEAVITGGVNSEMGLAIKSDGTFYLTEYTNAPRLFRLNPETGATTFIANLETIYPHGGDFSNISLSSSDNCSGETINQIAGLPSGSEFPIGITTNTFEVTDASGNKFTCSFDVTVTDSEAPEALAKDITVQIGETGNVLITAADIDNGSSDSCGLGSMSVSPDTFTCSQVGVNTVTLTVIDNSGNEASTTATVTVEDNIPPSITCSGDIEVDTDLGLCQAMVTIPVPIVSDNCPFLGSGTGTESDPFTTLERANTVANGSYFFNINGNSFSTEIENGWILIASSSKTTSLPELQTTSGLTLQSNMILAPSVYADGSISAI